MRHFAAGHRVIQTRWSDREKDGSVKSRLVLKSFNHDRGPTHTDMLAPTPSHPTENNVGQQLVQKNRHHDRDYIAVATGVHTAFLHADIDQTFLQNLMKAAELASDEIWNIEGALKTNGGKRRACDINM